MIKQVSFDVWNTLVKPNPLYATLRTEALAELVGVDFETAKKAYTTTKRQVDHAAEACGIGLATNEVYLLLMANVGVAVVNQHHTGITFRCMVERLFEKHPPVVTDAAKQLHAALIDRGMIINIASNSNFISGHVMHPFLQSEFGAVDFGVYSDLIEASKPNRMFFSRIMYEEGYRQADTILHVGDNLICDIGGARAVGMKAAYVANPDTIYDVVINAIKEYA